MRARAESARVFGKWAKYPCFKSRKKSRKTAEYTTSGIRFLENLLSSKSPAP
ncbi:hypothetical protein QIS99_24805 [Streptomyces sp. B-S-A8]|uniref:Uncharacterized protein n=1 Tax=Streptomyces solicavernae TaxID=3043614 RepID=A0ABT6RY76_9ACTN|nr:hypothetical protein [Streptomyces sp. B-S-A8]MDI3389391.1 hypothetical protein [Streptomyces sp. B-S-A8]